MNPLTHNTQTISHNPSPAVEIQVTDQPITFQPNEDNIVATPLKLVNSKHTKKNKFDQKQAKIFHRIQKKRQES